jgi:hypothetical protein
MKALQNPSCPVLIAPNDHGDREITLENPTLENTVPDNSSVTTGFRNNVSDDQQRPRILLTGFTGVLGKRFAYRLAALGYEVVSPDSTSRSPPGSVPFPAMSVRKDSVSRPRSSTICAVRAREVSGIWPRALT